MWFLQARCGLLFTIINNNQSELFAAARNQGPAAAVSLRRKDDKGQLPALWSIFKLAPNGRKHSKINEYTLDVGSGTEKAHF